jgi:hypothetical protein
MPFSRSVPTSPQTPREELGIWWQPDMMEHLIAGLRKAAVDA